MAGRSSFDDRYGFEDPLSDSYHPEPAAPSRTEHFMQGASLRGLAVQRPARARYTPPTHDPSGNPLSKKAQQGLSRQQRQRSEAGQAGAAVQKRRRWEATPEGRERLKDAPALLGTSMSPAQVHHNVFGTTVSGHGYGEQQLPGMENPHAVGTPPRWEELSPLQQADTHKALKRLAGTTVEQMSHDFGAQLDQAHARARAAGHVRTGTGEAIPFTKHFYDTGHPSDAPEPLDRPAHLLRQAAQKHGVELGVMVASTALTSPNTKFTQGPRGERTSPNIKAAEEAIIQHKRGVDPGRMGHIKDPETGKTMSTARPTNIVRAGRMLEHVAAGGKLGEARNAPSRSSPEGSSMWRAPKVGPFANSFQPDTPDYFVSDIHSGGGGMLPHLGTEKPFRLDESGSPVRNPEFRNDPRSDEELIEHHGGPHKVFAKYKSEREEAIGRVPNFHAAADYAARMAIGRRGLGSSVRQMQASQWGEEQILRKQQTPKLDVPSHEDAYPDPRTVGKQFRGVAGSHQLDLFS